MLIKNWYYLFDSLNGYFIQLLLNIDVLYIIVDNNVYTFYCLVRSLSISSNQNADTCIYFSVHDSFLD